jgi:hypothetical protein
MRRFVFFSLIIALLMFNVQNSFAADKQIFELKNPDYKVSPHTGMTRQHWFDAAKYMLEGAFGYVKTIDDPMQFPKQHEKTYPRNESQVPTEKLEGLSRTLFVAAPLLREYPDLAMNGIGVADYYRHQILNLINPEHPSFIKHRARNGGPSQILVEFGALAISLFTAPEVLWDPFTKEQKDKLAAVMMSYGDGPTVGSNWRFFNIFVMSFFKTQGYPINDELMKDYLQKSLDAYRGYGWYNDSPAYDYYSMWAFQMYGILWSKFFGEKHYPDYAAQFMKNFNDLHGNYPLLFARDGRMIMWSRSIAYRYAAATPFMLMGLENDPKTNWGWMRRISSGNLLQFFQHPDFMEDGVPTLGFYGPYEPATQIYSCRGSVYWGGKVFLGLLVPADHPYWQSVENEGPWEKQLKKGRVYNLFQPGSNTLTTNYPNIGASEVRAWCHETVAADWQKFRSSENYNRLAYHSEFLWQADGPNGEIAMNYGIRNAKNDWEVLRLYTFQSFKDGVYHRDAVLETNREIKFRLNDIPLPNGTLRVDQLSSPLDTELRLGHYALPEIGQPIKRSIRRIAGIEVYIVDNGRYQLAMAAGSGFSGMEFVETNGLNPESDKSFIITAKTAVKSGHSHTLVSVMLWKKSGQRFTASDFREFKRYAKDKNRLFKP